MPDQPTRVLVTGAGGFIGHHLVTYLKQRGYWVRGVDLKYPEYTPIDADEFELRDLRRWDECLQATRGRRRRVRSRRRHGRHGVHLRQPRHHPAQQRAHQPPHARGGTAQRGVPLPVQLLGLHLSRSTSRPTPRSSRSRRRTPTRPTRRTPTGGRSWSPSGSASTTPTSSGWRRGSRASTTSTGPTAPTTAAGRRRRRPSAGRSPWPSRRRNGRDLGRRRADALLLLCRRLRRGHLPPDAVGVPGAAQPRDRRAGQHQRAYRAHHRALRQAGPRACSTSTGRRAFGAATPTTPSCARCSAGSRPPR